MFTLLIVVFDVSHKASIQSVLMIAYTLPSVFLSAPAGVYADRHDKRTLMIATNAIRGVLILLIPIIQVLPVVGDQAWPLIVITFLFSSVGQLFAPAEAASIPSLVRRDQIMGATSLFMTTVILTLVLGVPAATLAIRLVGERAPVLHRHRALRRGGAVRSGGSARRCARRARCQSAPPACAASCARGSA